MKKLLFWFWKGSYQKSISIQIKKNEQHFKCRPFFYESEKSVLFHQEFLNNILSGISDRQVINPCGNIIQVDGHHQFSAESNAIFRVNFHPQCIGNFNIDVLRDQRIHFEGEIP